MEGGLAAPAAACGAAGTRALRRAGARGAGRDAVAAGRGVGRVCGGLGGRKAAREGNLHCRRRAGVPRLPPPPSYLSDRPRPSPRANRTRHVPHPVLIGHVAAAPQTEPDADGAGGDGAGGGDGAVAGGAAPPEVFERSVDWSQTSSLCPPRPPRARRRRARGRAADGRGAGRAGGENDATYEGEWVQGRRHGKVRTEGLS